jgi:hypothetical protein
MSQIIAMAKKLQEYEEIIEDLKKNGSSPGDSKTSVLGLDQSELHLNMPGPVPDHLSESDHSLPSRSYDNAYRERDDSVKIKTSEGLLSDLSLDENGKVCQLNSIQKYI